MRARHVLPLLLCTGCSSFWAEQSSPARQPFRTDHVLDATAPGIVELVLSTCATEQPGLSAETGEVDVWDRACGWDLLDITRQGLGLNTAFPGAWIFPTDAMGDALAVGPHEGVAELAHVEDRPAGLGCDHRVRFTERWEDLEFSVGEIAWDERGGEPGLRISLVPGDVVYDLTTGTLRGRLPVVDVSSHSDMECPTSVALVAQILASPALFSAVGHTVSVMDPSIDLWLLPVPVGPGDVPVDVVVDFDHAEVAVFGGAEPGLLSALGHDTTLEMLEAQGLDVRSAVDRWVNVLEAQLAPVGDELGFAIELETRGETRFCEQWVDADGYHIDMSARRTCALPDLPTRTSKTPGKGR